MLIRCLVLKERFIFNHAKLIFNEKYLPVNSAHYRTSMVRCIFIYISRLRFYYISFIQYPIKNYLCTHPASKLGTLRRCGCEWACPWNKIAIERVSCSPPTFPRGPRRRRRGPADSLPRRATGWRSDRSPRWDTGHRKRLDADRTFKQARPARL